MLEAYQKLRKEKRTPVVKEVVKVISSEEIEITLNEVQKTIEEVSNLNKKLTEEIAQCKERQVSDEAYKKLLDRLDNDEEKLRLEGKIYLLTRQVVNLTSELQDTKDNFRAFEDRADREQYWLKQQLHEATGKDDEDETVERILCRMRLASEKLSKLLATV